MEKHGLPDETCQNYEATDDFRATRRASARRACPPPAGRSRATHPTARRSRTRRCGRSRSTATRSAAPTSTRPAPRSRRRRSCRRRSSPTARSRAASTPPTSSRRSARRALRRRRNFGAIRRDSRRSVRPLQARRRRSPRTRAASSSRRRRLPMANHILSIVGWGRDATHGDYWLLRNSWGTYWGEGGFAKIKMGGKNLGVENSCSWGTPAPMQAAQERAAPPRLHQDVHDGRAVKAGTCTLTMRRRRGRRRARRTPTSAWCRRCRSTRTRRRRGTCAPSATPR